MDVDDFSIDYNDIRINALCILDVLICPVAIKILLVLTVLRGFV